MTTSTQNRGRSMRWMALLGLALVVLPAFAGEASADDRWGGYYGRGYGGPQYYGRGYGGYAPRGYGYGPRPYNYGPRTYGRGYGYGPRPYNGFYNYGVPYGGPGFGSPFYRPGFSLSIGGFPY